MLRGMLFLVMLCLLHILSTAKTLACTMEKSWYIMEVFILSLAYEDDEIEDCKERKLRKLAVTQDSVKKDH